MRFYPLLVFVILISVACQQKESSPETADLPADVQALSLIGDTLQTNIQPLPEKLSSRIDSLSAAALAEGDTVNHLIWEARKTAYSGDYRQALEEFSEAIESYPENPWLYRHRGHRYLTLRQFDEAIDDFQTAAQLFEGQEDQTEPDGLPNAQGIPLSSLQTNTWYHLGLAHYLKGEYDQANLAYDAGLQVADNDDMRVAFLYWYYMSLRKVGNDLKAGQLLEQVSPDLDLIENTSYHELLMVFKGEFTEKEVLDDDNSALDNATLGYGLGFWHHINGREERAYGIWEDVVENGNWAAFGYIASEAELARR
ncbi:tetratricopeptide repeat protein [Gracilimonas mengyeensis]|uniref:Tetratricopeptide repeat-containing protein n=1 Tax=Gracilimonas mengyeensis TaxID=1302730 RepID=A0A521BVB6_9BACT|nr:tetratricopeptide repeat protein [Gracilimonas mengyeensis]SMO51106.1 Tetratricopeptide repeat-containing protein [Gracilimonas mengyeensis]